MTNRREQLKCCAIAKNSQSLDHLIIYHLPVLKVEHIYELKTNVSIADLLIPISHIQKVCKFRPKQTNGIPIL